MERRPERYSRDRDGKGDRFVEHRFGRERPRAYHGAEDDMESPLDDHRVNKLHDGEPDSIQYNSIDSESEGPKVHFATISSYLPTILHRSAKAIEGPETHLASYIELYKGTPNPSHEYKTYRHVFLSRNLLFTYIRKAYPKGHERQPLQRDPFPRNVTVIESTAQPTKETRYAFRSWHYITIELRLQADGSNRKVYVDTGYAISIMDKT